jgi:hypothetical protein
LKGNTPLPAFLILPPLSLRRKYCPTLEVKISKIILAKNSRIALKMLSIIDVNYVVTQRHGKWVILSANGSFAVATNDIGNGR